MALCWCWHSNFLGHCDAHEPETHWFGVVPPFIVASPCSRGLLGLVISWRGCARVLVGVEILCLLGDCGRRGKLISLRTSCLIIVFV